jgi:hypothetical protein
LVKVLVCIDPSMVSAHSEIPNAPENPTAENAALRVWLVEENRPAVAALVSAARITVAASTAVTVRMSLIVTSTVGRCDQTRLEARRRRQHATPPLDVKDLY